MKKFKVKKLLCCLCSAAVILSFAAAPGFQASAAEAVPKDVKNHWAKPYITKAIQAGLVSGYDDGTFRPNVAVSRAEFAYMLNAVLGNTASASIQFSDVKSGSWYYNAVQKAIAAGYASGYDNGTFKPTASITRQEASVMLSRIIPTYNKSAALTQFKDASAVSSWAKDSMSRAVGKGYISGSASGKEVRLDPKGKLTRAQAVVIICKLLENETIVKSTAAISSSSTLKDAIYSNGITLPSGSSVSLNLSNCVVLGNLNISGSETVTATNSRIVNALMKGRGAQLNARGETSVKSVSVTGDGALNSSVSSSSSMYSSGFESVSLGANARASLSGGFSDVSLNGSSSAVSLNGAKVAALTVASAATGTDIVSDSSSSVSKATVNGASASFRGPGVISVMAANADSITYEKRPSTLTTGKNVKKAPVLSAGSLSILSEPKNGATNVAVDEKIKLTFSQPIKAYDGSAISSSDVDELLELRKGSSSGIEVSFDASINSAKTIITITPQSKLSEDTRYYITMAKNRVKNADGKANEAFSSYFITKASEDSDQKEGDITFYPKSGAKNVELDETLSITFPAKIMNYDGSSISKSDLQDIIILRKTSSRGDDVDFTASINSGKTKITITPDDDLTADTKYYLAIESKSLKYSSSKSTVDAESVTWTTEGSEDMVTFSPKHKATGVSPSVSPTITFDEAIIRYNGSNVTSSYIEDTVELREGSSSGKAVDFEASINSTKKKITIEPSSKLKAGTKYYLSFDSKAFRLKSDESKVPAASIYFTVSGSQSAAYISSVSSSETSISATVHGSLRGTIYAVLLPEGSSRPTASQIKNGQNSSGVTLTSNCVANTATLSANTEKKLTFTELETNTAYTLCIVLYPSGDEASSVVSKSVSTAKAAIPAALLSDITLSEGSLSFEAEKKTYNVTLPNATKEVTVTAKASDGGNISFDGGSTSVSGSYAKSVDLSSGKATLTITVFDAAKTESVYEIRFTVSSNTDLETLTANGTNIKGSLSYSLKESDNSLVTIYIETEDPQAEITGGISDVHTREVTLTVNPGETKKYSFTVVSTNNAEKDYTITLDHPAPQAAE